MQVASRNQRHVQSQEAEKQEMKTISNSGSTPAGNSGEKPSQNSGNKASAASQESGIEVIETAYSRTNAKKRMMARPPTADTQSNQRPNTGPSSRPPLGTQPGNFVQTPKGDMHMIGSTESAGSNTIQPQNFGFQTRTGSGAQLATTNFLSEGDFERANTDIEDEVESSEYYEEEVTDHEAMA